MNSLVRRLYGEGCKTSGQMKARIAELVENVEKKEAAPAQKRPPGRPRKVLPVAAETSEFSGKLPLAEKAEKTIKEQGAPKRTQEKKQIPAPAKSKAPRERVPRAEKEEKRTFMKILDYYSGSRLHPHSADFQVGLANRCCLHIAKRLKPVSDSVYLIAKVRTPHGTSSYVSDAVKNQKKGVLVHIISIDLSTRVWQYTVSGQNEAFKPRGLDSVLGRIIAKEQNSA
jgi:hypothetical protein